MEDGLRPHRAEVAVAVLEERVVELLEDGGHARLREGEDDVAGRGRAGGGAGPARGPPRIVETGPGHGHERTRDAPRAPRR
ncbi:hypothetical protein GCM10009790_03550 [Georgenia ruanii]